MYNLKCQSWNMQTGQDFKYRDLVCPAGLSSRPSKLIHLSDLSCWVYAYCTMHIITGKVHMLQNAHMAKCIYVAKCTFCKLHGLQSAGIVKCKCCKVHVLQHLTYCILYIASYTLHLTHHSNLSNFNSRNL